MLNHKRSYPNSLKIIWLFLVLAVVTHTIPIHEAKGAAAVQATYYVAPSGSDSNPGTSAQPFATVEKARDVVRTINANMTGDIYVYLKQGDYYVDRTIQFNEQDSGTNGHNVYYKNGDAVGSARLIGGQKVTGWTPYSGNIYKTNVGAGWKFNALYENGRTAWKARYPNKRSSRYTMAQADYLKSENVNGSSTVLQYGSGDLNPTGWDLKEAQVFVWSGGTWNWFTDTVPITGINTTTRQITLREPTRYPLYRNNAGSRYYVQGVLELLDQPGEFYLNSATGDLYYWAINGDINTQTIIAPKVQTLLELKGSAPSNRIANIVFEGLSFEATDFTDWFRHAWIKAGDSGESHAYNIYDREINLPHLRTGAILLQNSRFIMIDKSHFKNLGLNAVYMLFDNDHNTVSRSWFEHIGHSGIFLEGGYPGEGDRNNSHLLTNNKIEYVGETVGNGGGIYVMNSSNNEVSYSEISNSPRYAIAWKTRWEPPASEKYLKDNVFKYLKISNSAQDSGDTAPVYAVGVNTINEYLNVNKVIQVTIDNTYAHPSMTDYAPYGVYMDDKSNAQYFENVEVTNVQNSQRRNNSATGHTEINTSWNNGFDKSKMDYANIGLKSDFPIEYNGNFSDSFENGFTNWSVGNGTPSANSSIKHSGSSSYAINEATDVIYKTLGSSYNRVVSLWFYDDASDSSMQSMARVDNGTWNNSGSWRGLGVDTATSSTHYVYRAGTSKTATNIPRTTGWHELKWDYTSGTQVDLYIDGTLVGSPVGITAFKGIAMGDFWADGQTGSNAFDDVAVQ
ncbi:right-handed parallel beta-helix repeat-containing protein [Saccharibacillus brassicae]|uniref:Right-handed parallel beta-helix repeat-containing protein n=1 Tax=Saccharibacillus brassicae TaxID=2583377 RepID=A0A4Y6V2M6_SACBS|nr:right-handed parallel beta-helix repeat-containing protein [Saccharibacillus brassicae]QDH23078.1 right-handed parallel beta-helix repeat-containing protein [Saccharibacillus brassicae]